MHFSSHLVVILLLNSNLATQTRISELEACKKHLEQVVTVVRNLVTTVDNIKPENYLIGKPTNCAELLVLGNNESGIYTIYPKLLNGTLDEELSVYCDMETDGGGWIVFQRRGDYLPRQNFFQNLEAYKRGFGQLDKEFWLGNENIYILTHQENVTLRVDLEDFDNATRYAVYRNFNVSNCKNKYKLHLGKYSYSGNVGDSLKFHDNKEFLTRDNDDIYKCAERSNGGWWYNNCHQSNLNGLYGKGPSNSGNVVSWSGFRGDRYSLKKSEMKIRPTDFKKRV